MAADRGRCGVVRAAGGELFRGPERCSSDLTNGRAMPTLLDDRADAPPSGVAANHEITVRVVAEGGGSGGQQRPRRRLPSFGSIVAALGIGVIALVGFLIVGALT